jgi:hypothetical protein
VAGVTLPEGVEKTSVSKKNGKVYTYYYWNPGRGTDREGERIKLPNADTEPNRKSFGPKLSDVKHRRRRPIHPDQSAI